MAYADFLSEGAQIPAGSALTSTVATTAPPDYLNDYYKQLIANQAAVGGAAYSEYTGPRVAPFTPDQINSFGMTRDAAGAYKPGLATATDTAGRAAASSGVAAAAPGMAEAGNTYRGALAQPGAAASADPYLQGAQGTVQGALTKPGGLASADPYLKAASGNVSDVSAYMNPYQDAVVNRIGELGNRNLMENIMPGLEGRYIKAGQFRGTGQSTETARAVRDTQEGISAAQSAALQQGYGAAQTAKGADLTRQGNLGATAATAAGQDRSTDVNAAAVQGNLGSTAANAANVDRSTTANIAQGQGTLANQQGNLAGQDAQNLNQTATTQGNLAAQNQTLGIAGANAVNTAGTQQQTLDQQNMQVGYENYLREQGWPQAQIDAQLKTGVGVGAVAPKVETKEGIEPIGTPAYTPSTTDKIAGTIAGAGSLFDAISKVAK